MPRTPRHASGAERTLELWSMYAHIDAYAHTYNAHIESWTAAQVVPVPLRDTHMHMQSFLTHTPQPQKNSYTHIPHKYTYTHTHIHICICSPYAYEHMHMGSLSDTHTLTANTEVTNCGASGADRRLRARRGMRCQVHSDFISIGTLSLWGLCLSRDFLSIETLSL